MSAGAGPRFEVRVVDEVLVEDLVRCTPAARASIESMVATLRGEGAPRDWLLRCEEEGQDGTRLKGSVKLYIPRPAGQWGAVLPVTRRLRNRPSCWSRWASVTQRDHGNRACTRSPIDGSTADRESAPERGLD